LDNRLIRRLLVFGCATVVGWAIGAAPLHADQVAGTPPISYRLIASQYPSSDSVVAAYTSDDWKLDRTGKTDDSSAVQAAMTAISAAGGGTLFLRAGIYRLDTALTVPAAVTLRGEIGRAANDPYHYTGTILAGYAGRGQATGAPLVTLSTSSGIRDCIVWYPEQNPYKIVPYPPSVDHSSDSTCVQNVVFINSYQAYRSGYHMSGRAYVRDIRGTALAVGVEIDGLADTGRVEGVSLSPEYWPHSGLPGSPKVRDTGYREYMRANGIGVLERRIDWTNTADVTVDGYNKGYCSDYSLNDEDLKKGNVTASPNGENYNYTITDCDYGVYLNSTANSGLIFTRFSIQASKAGFYLGEHCATIATLLDNTIDCPGYTIDDHGPGRVLIRDCKFRAGQMNVSAGVFDCAASSFDQPASHVVSGDGLVNATFVGDKFEGGKPDISGSDQAQACVHVDQASLPAPITFDAPSIDFEQRRAPIRQRLYVVTSPEFGAVADGKTDCGAALRSALAAAHTAGGGIVFLPGGVYALSEPVTVPSGVELRGAFDGPHDANTAGSCVLITSPAGAATGTPMITLLAGSMLRGLNFHYANQNIDNIVDFPFLVRGDGAGIVIQNVASANVSRFIDLMTNRCDNAFVDHIEGQPIHVGLEVGGGSQNDSVIDCQFNPSNWTFSTLFNAPKVVYPKDPAKRSAVVGAYIQSLQEHGDVFVLGDCTGLRFYRNFVFAGRHGLRCVAENGRGPSGVCLELGVDGSTTAVRIDALGAQGFPLIDSQLVVTSTLEGQRHDIELGADFTGAAEFYGANMWGGHTDSSVQVEGGKLRLDGAHLRDPGNPAFNITSGAIVASACCVRRDPDVLPAGLPVASNVSLLGDILPTPAAPSVQLPASANVLYTDPGSKPSAAK